MKPEYEKVRGGVISAKAFHAAQKEGPGTVVRCWIGDEESRLKVLEHQMDGIVFKVLDHPNAEGIIKVTETFFPPSAFPTSMETHAHILAHGTDPWRSAAPNHIQEGQRA